MGTNGVSSNTTFHRLIEERLRGTDKEEYERYKQLTPQEKEEYCNAEMQNINPLDEQEWFRTRKIFSPLLARCLSPGVIIDIAKYTARMRAGLHNNNEFFLIRKKLERVDGGLTTEDETRLLLPYYLMLTEGIFIAYAEILIYLIIENGTQYYYGKGEEIIRMPSIKKLPDIREEDLAKKMMFLRWEACGYVADIVDRKLRNSIAHMSFIVLDNGDVIYGDDHSSVRITNEELEAKCEQIIDFCNCAWSVIEKSLAEYIEKNSDELKVS